MSPANQYFVSSPGDQLNEQRQFYAVGNQTDANSFNQQSVSSIKFKFGFN